MIYHDYQIENGRPKPYIGMPVFYNPWAAWLFIDKMPVVGKGFPLLFNRAKNNTGLVLDTYGFKDYNNYHLPSEFNCPAMPRDVLLYSIQRMGWPSPCSTAIELMKDGVWKYSSDIGSRYILPIPPRVNIKDLFDGAENKSFTLEELAQHNGKPGSISCAKCGGKLKSLQFCFSFTQFCPTCEK